jgi:hypothetical protein
MLPVDSKYANSLSSCAPSPPSLISLLLAGLAMAVELFRYRGAARDGGTLEYIFETDEQDVPRGTVRQEKAIEIAAEFMTTEDRQAPYSAQSQSVAISIPSSVASRFTP